MAKGTARGDPAASLAGLAARARQNGAAEGALAQREAVCIRKQVNTLDISLPPLSGLALNLPSQLAEINNGQRIICSSDRLGSSLASPRLSCEQSGQSVQISTEFEPSQPAPFSLGKTVVVPQTNVQTKESAAHRVELREGATVEDLVNGLQAIGSTARDVIAILEALKANGALQAELEVI